jgi:hypothetical protein
MDIHYRRLLGMMLAATVATTATMSLASAQATGATKKTHARTYDHRSPARAHSRYTVQPAPQTQIACTQLGCNPVPPGCHPEPQRYFSGMTTGFDAVVCP